MSVLITTVDRIIDMHEVDTFPALSGIVGYLNSDTWEGFTPETLMVLSVTFTACLDWRSVRVQFKLEVDFEKFAFCEPPYRFTREFADILTIGRAPAGD